MNYRFEIGKSNAVKATNELGAVEIVPPWAWHAEALRQLIYERETLRVRVAELELVIAARSPK